MKTSPAPPKKSPASKARHKVGRVTPCVPSPATQRLRIHPNGGQRTARPTSLRREFRAWRASLPAGLERDTLLMPDAIAESVVQEAERFLQAALPEDFAERLAAKAHYLYPRHRHFRQVLNCRGNLGRDMLYMFMRHWTCAWLKRERPGLFKQLPRDYAQGRPLPVTAPGLPPGHPNPRSLVTGDCLRPTEVS